jgi:catechol 2,3-dioxygenase-like lactoylglutathione lyase family enzyme
MSTIRTIGGGLALTAIAAVSPPPSSGGQSVAQSASALASPNAAGVAMGHLHFRVKDVAANARFWIALGGRPVNAGWFAAPGREVIAFNDVLVVLEPGTPSGVSDGAVVNHVAFRVPSLAPVEAAGIAVERLANFVGVAYVRTPEGERVELFENAATNLTFTPDSGQSDPVIARHNRPVTVPIAFHHIHLYLPDAATVPEAKAWYTRMFGGVPGKRSQYDATDVPGLNLNFSAAPRPTQPTRGRMLDHIGLEVRHLEAFCTRLKGMGVRFDEDYTKDRAGHGRATLTDPWGTSIELTEGLAIL